MTTLIQASLEEELRRLVIRYGRGKELKVVHDPRRVRGTVIDKMKDIEGEVVDHTIYIYVEELENSLDILAHEYFEYVFDIVFIRRHQNLFNAIIKGFTEAFEKDFYADKESWIETLVANEREKRKEK